MAASADGEIEMDDRTVRAALERHWDASDASDFEAEHEIYCEDAVLDYPQSGERIRGRHNIQESRFVQPNKKRFTVRRMIGSGDLWVTEFVLGYDGILQGIRGLGGGLFRPDRRSFEGNRRQPGHDRGVQGRHSRQRPAFPGRIEDREAAVEAEEERGGP